MLLSIALNSVPVASLQIVYLHLPRRLHVGMMTVLLLIRPLDFVMRLKVPQMTEKTFKQGRQNPRAPDCFDHHKRMMMVLVWTWGTSSYESISNKEEIWKGTLQFKASQHMKGVATILGVFVLFALIWSKGLLLSSLWALSCPFYLRNKVCKPTACRPRASF